MSFRVLWPASVLVLMLIVSNLPLGSGASYVQQIPATIGEQKTVVLLMKFHDMRTEPDPPSHYSNRVFSEMNAYYLEASFDQVSVSGKVYGWYTLPQPWSYYINSEYPLGNRRVMMEDSVKTADAHVDFRNFRYAIIIFNNHLVAPPACCVAFAEGDQDFQTGIARDGQRILLPNPPVLTHDLSETEKQLALADLLVHVFGRSCLSF